MVDYLHITILLDPQLAHNDVVHTARWISPCVGLIISETSRGLSIALLTPVVYWEMCQQNFESV